jgi:hypothetical protein
MPTTPTGTPAKSGRNESEPPWARARERMRRSARHWTWFAVLTAVLSLAPGCAFDLVRVKQEPVMLDAQPVQRPSWTLTEKVAVGIGTGFSTKLESGTRWTYVGRIPQGEVYRTTDQIVTVVGPNIFEAQIVISNGLLEGFYLPVERTYTPASEPCELKTAPTEPAR